MLRTTLISPIALFPLTVLALAACSGPDPALVGTWEYQGTGYGGMESYDYTLVFNADGTFSATDVETNSADHLNGPGCISTSEDRGTFTTGSENGGLVFITTATTSATGVTSCIDPSLDMPMTAFASHTSPSQHSYVISGDTLTVTLGSTSLSYTRR